VKGVKSFEVENDDVINIYTGSGSSVILNESITSKQPLIPIPLSIVTSSRYHGYLYGNKQFMFFVGGGQAYYTYGDLGYILDIKIEEATPNTILGMPESRDILTELHIQ